jgi:TolB-like protein
MPSILPGFEYDIFISYRHNDNRSGWVTEFVKALQEELASTIKDPVSVYFDTNPHDGLLETHDVDDSLKEKLKCIIFIPIISQTYCDPKSFAWRNEFLVFKKLANEDQFGMKIKLQNGNITSRILPVKIHELDAEDKLIIENEIGSSLRAIEFIFKSAGVNRPLLAHEDHPQDNLNKTFYRDQVNKVANAIKDLTNSLKRSEFRGDSKSSSSSTPLSSKPKSFNKHVLRLIISSVFLSLFVFILYLTLYKNRLNVKENNSVAVLAFKDLSEKKDQEWFSDGLSDEIMNRLANLRQLKVTARTSSFYFKHKEASIREIANRLGVENVLEGSVQRIGNQIRITAQLIRAQDEVHLWSQSYDRSANDLFQVETEIAINIANSLLSNLTNKDKEELGYNGASNQEAYEMYLRGNFFHDKYRNSFNNDDFFNAERYFKRAIQIDPGYADAYGELANIYDTFGDIKNHKKWDARDSVVALTSALSIKSISLLRVKLYSFSKTDKNRNIDSCYRYLKQMIQINRNDTRVIRATAVFYLQCGLIDLSENYNEKLVKADPLSSTGYNYLAADQLYQGDLDNLYMYSMKALELDPNNHQATANLFNYYLIKRDTTNIKPIVFTMLKSDHPSSVKSFFKPYEIFLKGDIKKALAEAPNSWVRVCLLYLSNSSKIDFLPAFNSLINDDPTISSYELEHSPLFEKIRGENDYKVVVELKKRNEDIFRKKYSELE